MQIIIIGCGKVGAKFAHVLSEEGHDVVIVDNDPHAFRMLAPNFNGVTVTGVPIDQDVLKKAGIETADALAAVTPDDNINIMTCQVAKEIFKVPNVIARIYNPAREHVFHQFGLRTICPTNLTVDTIHSMVMGEDNITQHSIAGSTVMFKQESVQPAMEGKKLGSLKFSEGTLVFGIIRNGNLQLADPGIRLSNGDILVIADKV